ncbi:MAG TPA: alkaline phosphatase family protein [Gaiellales bacterium]|jgi:predicted AlkP superfamily phosphohydrolase/phosphomutase
MTRLLVVGLDGGTDSVIGLPDANLPSIAKLRAEGASATLTSTVPPITAAAWPSMMTGWNPGRHGMYDFRTLSIERYSRLWGAGHSASFEEGRDFVTSRRWSGAAFWDQLDGPAAVLSVPMTFPAWPIDGRMVAGFPLPDYGRNHTQPPELAGDMPPLLDFADRIGKLSDSELADRCRALVEQQREIVTRWLREDAHDAVVVVFQSTDFAQHRLWKYLDQPGHPLREALLEMYRSIDALVGEARELLGDEGTVVVVSDHGFGPHPRTFVRTDRVLADAGLLHAGGAAGRGEGVTRALRRAPALRRALRTLIGRLPGGARDRIAARATGASRVEWPRSQAYRIPLYPPAEGIVVNLRGRQQQGAVEPGSEYEQVRDRIIETLEGLRDPSTGDRVLQWARRREELFSGAHLDEAPDVVALFDPRYKAASGLGELFEPVPAQILDEYSGVHAMEGIFAAAGRGIRAGVDLGTRSILDVAPTLLALLGRPVPADSDGTVIDAALEDAAAVRTGDATYADRASGGEPALTAEEEATLEESLRALGYLE